MGGRYVTAMVSHSATAVGGDDATELTVDQLAVRAGVSVRTVRFYAGKRLLPPPRLVGRTGYYGSAHLARLTLIRDLTEAGYTLAAVEAFLRDLPADADAEAVTLYGALLTPWAGRDTIVLTRAELAERACRPLDDEAVALLAGAGALAILDDGRVALSEGQLELALRLLDLDAPLDALVEAGEIVRRHAASLARDLQRVFRERIIAELGDADPAARERLRALAAALRPLTIQALVAAYTEALEAEVRGAARR
jgi:DNA-binding transcriptional MerR regulator